MKRVIYKFLKGTNCLMTSRLDVIKTPAKNLKQQFELYEVYEELSANGLQNMHSDLWVYITTGKVETVSEVSQQSRCSES